MWKNNASPTTSVTEFAIRALYHLKKNVSMTDFRLKAQILSVEQLWTLQMAAWNYRLRNFKESIPVYLRNFFVPKPKMNYETRNQVSVSKMLAKSNVIADGFQFRLANLDNQLGTSVALRKILMVPISRFCFVNRCKSLLLSGDFESF